MKTKTQLYFERITRLVIGWVIILAVGVLSSCDNEDDDEDITPEPEDNIVELAQSQDQLSTLVSALTKYDDLVSALSDESGNYTVFAPTNTAFNALLSALEYEDLDAVPEDLLKQLLQYHVVAGTAATSGDLSDGQVIETLLSGESVTVSINGTTVMINMSTVTTADVEATNGIVHIIDAVLVPSSLETRDIVEIAGATESLSTLVSALGRFPDIVNALGDNQSTFTVFAPTNDAFADLLGVLGYSSLDEIPDELLEQVLQYHVIASASLLSTDLSDGQSAETLLSGESISVTIDGSDVFINDSQVIAPDVEAINGVVHVIDAVLVPSFVETSDIVEIASNTDDLSILVSALTKFPDLVEALETNSGSYTVFAPTNAAFADLLSVTGQTELDDIPENVLRRVLEYHVISGSELESGALTDGQTAETLLGESVTVSKNGDQVSIDNSNVANADITAVNGIVHILDAVLVPELEASIVNTVVEPAYFNKDFTILTDAVVKAELLETLTDPTMEYTVFAPTNDAFEAAGINSLENLTKEDLTPILTYHVLGSEVVKSALPSTGSAVSTLNGDFYLSINDNGVFINGTSEVVATDIQPGTDDNGVVHVIDRTLIPASENIVEIAVAASQASEAEFSQLVAALTAVEEDANAADLVTALSSSETGDGAPFTVFAPTDAAFEALYTAAGVEDLDGLVNALGIATVEAVLKYHVISGSRVFSTDLPNIDGPVTTLEGGTISINLSTLTITENDTNSLDDASEASITDTDILATNGVIHTIDKVILP